MLLRAFAPILINDAMVLTYGCLIEILVQFMTMYYNFIIIAGIVSVGRCCMILAVQILLSVL